MFIDFIGNREMEKLVYSDIEAFKLYLIGKFKPAGVNQIVYSLRSFLKYYSKHNPLKFDFKDISGVKNVTGPKSIPNLAEIEKILKSPNLFERSHDVKLRNAAILEVLFATGARISEVLNMKMADLKENGDVLIVGKGKKRRYLYLNDRSRAFLSVYLGNKRDASPYVFAPIRGRRAEKEREMLDASTFRRQLNEYIKKLDLGLKVTAHTLRAAFATLRLENGANLDTVRIALGHSSITTTQRYLSLSQKFIKKDLANADPLRRYK